MTSSQNPHQRLREQYVQYLKTFKIEETKFYALLRDPLFHDIYDGASEKHKVICIPPDLFTREVMKNAQKYQVIQILNSNLCIQKDTGDELKMTDGNTNEGLLGITSCGHKNVDNTFVVTKGFRRKMKFSIICEETHYSSKNYQPFKVWMIDQCIVEHHKELENVVTKHLYKNIQRMLEEREKEQKLKLLEPTSLGEFNAFVTEKCSIQAMQIIQNFVNVFNTSYIILKGSKEPTKQKIEFMFKQLCEEILLSNELSQKNDDKDERNIVLCKNAATSIFLSGIYGKLFPNWKEFNNEMDELLMECSNCLQDITFKDLDISEPFWIEQDDALSVIRNINQKTNSFEKMKCIKDTCDKIFETISSKYENSYTKNTQQIALTTDELIPILTHVLIRAKVEYLESNISFMNSFLIDELASTEYGFTLVSVEAAVEYMKREARKRNVKLDNQFKLLEQQKLAPNEIEDIQNPDSLYDSHDEVEIHTSHTPRQRKSEDMNLTRKKSGVIEVKRKNNPEEDQKKSQNITTVSSSGSHSRSTSFLGNIIGSLFGGGKTKSSIGATSEKSKQHQKYIENSSNSHCDAVKRSQSMGFIDSRKNLNQTPKPSLEKKMVSCSSMSSTSHKVSKLSNSFHQQQQQHHQQQQNDGEFLHTSKAMPNGVEMKNNKKAPPKSINISKNQDLGDFMMSLLDDE